MTDNPNDLPTDADGNILSPEELDITEDQRVKQLEEGRFLITGEEGAPARTVDIDELEFGPEPSTDEPPEAAPPTELDADAVHGWLADRLEAADSRYGFDITAVFEGEVVRQELFSNDVITTFENLLVWYAQHVGGDTPVEDVLGILIAQSTAPIRLPPNAVESITRANGVEPSDSIADLFEVVRRDGGLRFPARDDAD